MSDKANGALPSVATIHLAGKPYEIVPFTVGEIEDFEAEGKIPDPDDAAAGVHRSYDRVLGAISRALSQHHPGLSPDTLRKMRINYTRELLPAYRRVLEISGLVREGPSPGEAPAGAASTGPSSTAA